MGQARVYDWVDRLLPDPALDPEQVGRAVALAHRATVTAAGLLEPWIEPPDVLQTCHRDLWADNVLPTADGGICVVDSENGGPADPSHELACVLFELARHDPGRARALTAAYHEAGGPAAVTRRGHVSMLITQLGHITELGAKDWLEPNPRTPDRSDAEARVG